MNRRMKHIIYVKYMKHNDLTCTLNLIFQKNISVHKHLNVQNNLYQTLKSRLCYSNDIMDDITLAKRLFVRQYCHSCSYNCIGKVFLSSFCTSYFMHYGQIIQYLSINYVSFLAHEYQSFKFFVCIFCLSSNF